MSEDNNLEGTILLDGQAFSLSDLANLGFDEVVAVKSSRIPAGSYEFVVEETKMEPKEITPKDSAEKIKVLAVGIKLKVARVFGVIQTPGEEPIEQDSLIDKVHFETFFVRTTESYGRLKQFLLDTGYEPTAEQRASFQTTLQGFVGHHFNGMIRWTKNRNDPDADPYVNLRHDKIKPAVAA